MKHTTTTRDLFVQLLKGARDFYAPPGIQLVEDRYVARIEFRAFGRDREGIIVGYHSSGDPIIAYRFASIDHFELLRRLDAAAAKRRDAHDPVDEEAGSWTSTRRLTTSELATTNLFGFGALIASDLLIRLELGLRDAIGRAEHDLATLIELWDALDGVEVDGSTYAKVTKRALNTRWTSSPRPDDDDVVEVRRPTPAELTAVGWLHSSAGYVRKGSSCLAVTSIAPRPTGDNVRKFEKTLAKVRKGVADRVAQVAHALGDRARKA